MSALSKPTRGMSDDLLRQAQEWQGRPDETPISGAGCWTLGDMKRAARYAARRCLMSRDYLADDPVRLAESAIACAIAVDPGISWVDAVAAGQADIWGAARWRRKERGQSLQGSGARFWLFWLDLESGLPTPTACEEPMTLAAVMDALPAEHVETLTLLAFTETAKDAAKAAGVTHTSFLHRAQRARRAALELWFDLDEAPPLKRLPTQRRRSGGTCPSGHEMTDENTTWESVGARRYRRCRTCRSARTHRGTAAHTKETPNE